jgi:hypothetical protein
LTGKNYCRKDSEAFAMSMEKMKIFVDWAGCWYYSLCGKELKV